MVRPPLSEGIAQKIVAELAKTFDEAMFLGADGAVAKVVTVTTFEAGPVPISLLARTRNLYELPLARPVTLNERTADSSWEISRQDVPPLDENSTL
jgi:hypothetical protein